MHNPWDDNKSSNGSNSSNNKGNKNKGFYDQKDLEDIANKFQKKMEEIFGAKKPSGGGNRGSGGDNGNNGGLIFSKKKVFIIASVIVFLIWAFSGFYTIRAEEQGVVLRLGKFHRVSPPGLSYKLPTPFEVLYKVPVTTVNREEVGYRENTGDDSPEESLMLTGDENIVDIDFEIQWKVKDAKDYLFNVRNFKRGDTVKFVAESVMRSVIGKTPISLALADGKSAIQVEAKELTQSILDSYNSGVEVVRLQLLKVEVPEQVIDAFRDVQTAKADRERAINQAQAYSNDVIPKARGNAAQIVEEAKGYKQAIIAEAQGKSSRFLAVYNEYVNSPQVTKKRIYLETMEQVLKGVDKVIIDDKIGGSGVVPYLPLGQHGKTIK